MSIRAFNTKMKKGETYKIEVNLPSAPTNLQVEVGGDTLVNDNIAETQWVKEDYVASTDDPTIYVIYSISGEINVKVYRIQHSYYQIQDWEANTFVFSANQGTWQPKWTYRPEYFAGLNSQFISFKSGMPWVHYQGAGFNKMYGNKCPARVMYVIPENYSIPKEPMVISLKGDVAPDFTHVRTERPYTQSTDVLKGEFSNDEGVWKADIMLDRLSPIAGATYEQNMRTGDVMRGNYILITHEYRRYDLGLTLNEVSVGYLNSAGHK